ncbi:MAG: hypothetical protein KF760_01995 [Candidatus Eremiobacteraeota bacterium]|nr:hypothetical protein [Candidatus Eremiobacteraeota bacterium]MCW5871632.1 hypothetical protein [Candidatus Eremiobacteraeota bacterium]
MKKTLLTVASAAVAVTCLAWAQPQGAKETVVIKEESAAAKKPKETLPSPGAAPKPKVARDPFVKGGGGGETAPPPMETRDAGPAVVKPGGPELTNQKPAEPAVAAPDVAVKGILLGPRGNRAIVAGPTMTFIVKQGDKLGDYKVAHIDRKSVVFTFKTKKFPIKLEDEFAAKK